MHDDRAERMIVPSRKKERGIMRRGLVIGGVILWFVSTALGQWPNPLKGITGGSGGGGRAPLAYVVLATVEFLNSSQILAEATGHAELANKYKAASEKLGQPGGATKENLGYVSEVQTENEKVLADKAKLKKVSKEKLTQALVHSGVAAFFEAKAVDSAKNAGMANLTNPGDTFILATIAPANLTSMVSLNKDLLAYAGTVGISTSEVEGEVQKRITDLDKG